MIRKEVTLSNLLETIRLLRLGASPDDVKMTKQESDEAAPVVSLLLREGHEPSDPDDRSAVEGLNSRLHSDVTKVRVSLTKVTMKNGNVRWQVAMKSTDTEGVETSELNCWAPTIVAGIYFILLKLLGVG